MLTREQGKFTPFGAEVLKMKRYWVFAYQIYYPSGGKNDCIDKIDDLDVLPELVAIYDSVDVLDMQERRWLDIDEVLAALNPAIK